MNPASSHYYDDYYYYYHYYYHHHYITITKPLPKPKLPNTLRKFCAIGEMPGPWEKFREVSRVGFFELELLRVGTYYMLDEIGEFENLKSLENEEFEV